jgi:hypothetical protein
MGGFRLGETWTTLCKACRREVQGDAAFCPECGESVATAPPDDDADELALTTALPRLTADPSAFRPDDLFDEDLSPPNPWRRTALIAMACAAGLALILIVALRGLGKSEKSTGPSAAATTEAERIEEPAEVPAVDAAPVEKLVNVPTGHRRSVVAPAPEGVGPQDLGRPYDVKFRALHGEGSRSLFPNREPAERRKHRLFEHNMVAITSQEGLDAHFSVWGVGGAGLGYTSAERYMVYRAVQLDHILKLDDSGGMRQWPDEAKYYLAEIHYGYSYEAIVHGDQFAFHTGVKADFGPANAGIEAYVASQSLSVHHRGIGLRPRSGDAIFAVTPREIANSYRADDEPAPIRVVYRHIPGARIPERSIEWRTPVVYEPRLVLKEADYVLYEPLPRGTYRLSAETPIDELKFKWINAVESSNNTCRGSGKKWKSITSTCRIAEGGGLKIWNPCSLCSGAAIPLTITVWKDR